MREVVSDPRWQALRESLVGTWIEDPRGGVRALRAYLASARSHRERVLRCRRVLNYLTGSGFRSGRITHPSIARLLQEVRAERKRYER